MGKAYSVGNRFDKALEFYKKSYSKGGTIAVVNIGDTYCKLNRHLEAVDYYLEFIDACEEDFNNPHKFDDNRCKFIERVAEIYKSYGKYKEALDVYLKESDVFALEIADIYFHGIGVPRDYEKALLYYRKALTPMYTRQYRYNGERTFTDTPQYKIAQCFYYGLGTKKDIKKAEFYVYLATNLMREQTSEKILDTDDYFFKQIKPHLTFAKNDFYRRVKDKLFWYPPLFTLFNNFNRSDDPYNVLHPLLSERGTPADDARFFVSYAYDYHIPRYGFGTRITDYKRKTKSRLKKKGYICLPELVKDEKKIPPLEENTIRFFPLLSLAFAHSDEEFEMVANHVIKFPIDYLMCDYDYGYYNNYFPRINTLPFEVGKKLYEILLLISFGEFHNKRCDAIYQIDADALLLEDLNRPLEIQI